MKAHTRFEYTRLAEALAESGLVDQKALQEALQLSASGGPYFPEALVEAGLVTDWELARVVCETFGLPFLPLDLCQPDVKAFEGLDSQILIGFGLVPVGRFGKVLTVAMPGMVEADVLKRLAAGTELTVLPVVGTVRQNRYFLQNHFGAPKAIQPPPPLPSAGKSLDAASVDLDPSWSSFFDEADAAVLFDLQAPSDDGDPQAE